MNRLKRAELTSGVGALVLGVGLERWFRTGSHLPPASMCSPEPSLSYRVCCVLLAAVFVLPVLRR